MPLQTGQVLQRRYHIIRLLGQGGMGSVYLAKDLRLEERRCAIKEQVPGPNVTSKALTQLRQQFHIEARTLAKLDHPNLPKVSDYFSYAGNEYLVMDYIEGKDLESALQKFAGPLPERPMLEWGIQVLNALVHLHRQDPPIIHRDIKPANIILTRQGEVKLVDFGLVKLLDPTNPRTITIMRGMGTPEYTPLEQYASNPNHTDGRTDIYAFAATLYHLLTAVAPADAPQRVIDSNLLLPPRQHNPALSKNIEAIILKGMSIAPEDRFQSAKLLRDALQGQLDRLNATPIDPKQNMIRPRTALGSKRQRQIGPKVMTVVLVSFLLLIVFWLRTWLRDTLSEAPVSESAIPASIVTNTALSAVVVESSSTPNLADYPVAVKFPDTPTPIPSQTPRPVPSNTQVVPVIPTATRTSPPIQASNTPLPPTSTVNRSVNQTEPTPVSVITTVTLINEEATAVPSSSTEEEEEKEEKEDTFTALATGDDAATATDIPATLVPTLANPTATFPAAATLVPTLANPTATFPAAAKLVPSVPMVSLNDELVQLGVTIAPTMILPGQPYWQVKEILLEFGPDSPAIQVDLQDEDGQRLTNQQVIFSWGSQSQSVPVEPAGYSSYWINFPIPATEQSYTVEVANQPSETIQGLRVPEPNSSEENPTYPLYLIIFEQVND